MKPAFFFHPSNASNSDAFLEVRAEYGWAGYGLAWAILERIASGDLRTLPMEDLRSFWLQTGSDRRVFLGVCDLLEAQGWLARKEIKDKEMQMRFWHMYSPVLEEQLLNKQLQYMAKVFTPSERVPRPGIPKAVRNAVLSAGACAYCGSGEELQVDHIYPYSKGGAHSIENFQPLCKACNYAKRDKTEEEYFTFIGIM